LFILVPEYECFWIDVDKLKELKVAVAGPSVFGELSLTGFLEEEGGEFVDFVFRNEVFLSVFDHSKIQGFLI